MFKRFLALILAAILIGTVFCGGITASAATTLSGANIKTYAEGLVGNSYATGMCLAFVADTFHQLGADRSSACCAYKYSRTYLTSTSSTNIPVGADVFFSGSGSTCSKCGNRCGHIGIYVGNGNVVHAMSGKVQETQLSTLDAYSNLSYIGWGVHGNVSLTGAAPQEYAKDEAYPTPAFAYPAAKSGVITLYDSNLKPYSTNIRNIAYNDLCTINAFYTNGYCSVTYPRSSGGTNTEIAKISDFIPNKVTPYTWKPSETLNTYTRSDMNTTFGSVFNTDSCKVVGQKNGYYQVIYPVKSGYKMGWVNPSFKPDTPDKPEDSRPPVIKPDPRVDGILKGKTIVAMAPKKISFSDGYISAGDVCKLYNYDSSSGYCQVDYPGGGANDVFSAGTVRTKTVAVTEFIAYNPNAKLETAHIPDTLHVYPTSDMADSIGGYTANWTLDPGDEYSIMNQSEGKTEVIYYCNRGKHAGCWKLGWCWLNYYWLDLNGNLNNADNGGLGSYGTADIYINGILRANDVNDFYSANGTYPSGSTYEIKDIRPYNGYTYNGVYSGKTSGTLTGNTSVSLKFTKKAVTCSSIVVSGNPSKTTYLEGENLNTSGLVVSATFSDGSKKDVTGSCSFSGYSNTPGTKTVTVSYSGKTTAFTVLVKSKSPTSISVTSKPKKTNYYVGEPVDLSGMVVKATYDNGTSANVADYEAFTNGLTESAGSKTVDVMYVYNNTVKTTSFTLNVTAPSLKLSAPSLTLEKGKTGSLTATTVPASQPVTWQSSNPTVATVANGVVTAVGKGSATVTATFSYQGRSYSAIAAVTVNAPQPVAGGQISVSSAEAHPGETVDLTVSVSGNPGISAFTLGFDYDTSRLKMKNAAVNSALGGQFAYNTSAVWVSNTDVKYNGAILTLTFEVLAAAEDGDAAVKVTCRPGDISNRNEEDVLFDVSSGKITVSTVHEHTWNSGTVATPATCTAYGLKIYVCTGCYEIRTETIPKTGHTDANKDCKCDVCGTVLASRPAVPADVTVTPSGDGEITVSWNPVPGATQYNVYRYRASDKAYRYLGTTFASADKRMEYVDRNVSAGTAYYYKVMAVLKIDAITLTGDLSASASALALGKPAVPQNVKAKAAGDKKITVTWDAVKGATQYNVYRYRASDKAYHYIGTTFATAALPTQYVNTGLTAGVTYYYKVLAACKGSGLTFVGNLSASVNAAAQGAPAVPQNAAAKASGDKAVTVSWNAVNGATQYNVYRYRGSDKKYHYLGTTFATDANPTQYVNTGLTAGTTYYYKVVAVKKTADYTLVSAMSASVSAKALTAPAAPKNVTALAAGTKMIVLYWGESAGATQYNIYRSASATGTYKYIGTSYSTDYVNQNLTAGSTYYYKVVAVNKTADYTLVSEQSAAVSAKAK